MTLACAIVGTGAWSRMALAPALGELPEAEITACVGETRDAADAFAHQHGIPEAFDSLDALLAAPARPDVVVVATPDSHHPAAVRACLASGTAVFCEKPLANTAATAWRLARDAERCGVPATVGYAFRFSPAIQALREDLAAGRIGEPWLIELFEHNPQFHPRRGKRMNWKGDPAHAAGGALFEYGSHAIDLAQWLLGPVHAVSANLARVLEGARLDDICTLQLRFAAPATGTLLASWVLPGGIPGIRVRLHGSEGTGEAILVQTADGAETYRRIALDGSAGEPLPITPIARPIYGYAKRHLVEFLARVAGRASRRDDRLPTLAEAAAVQEVLDAALRATETWVPVRRKQANKEETV